MTPAASQRHTPIRGIRYVSLFESSGYAEAARRQILGLKRAGVPLTWTPVRRGSTEHRCYTPVTARTVGDADLDPVCNAPVEHDWVLVHSVPEHFPAWTVDVDGRRRAGITVWETDRLPHTWPALLNRMDRLFVPCHFNRDVFTRCGVRQPVHLLPHIAPTDPLPPRRDIRGIPAGHFVFYTINTWTARKALWLTLKAYLAAFTSRDPVTLVIKTTREDLTRPRCLGNSYASSRQSVRRILRDFPDPAAVVLMDGEVPAADIAALHARGDCFVSLTRSEGWGLGAFEAAAHGIPVIITAYGGQLDYLQPDPIGLVRARLIPVDDPMGYPSFAPDQNWADPDLAHASTLMRTIAEAPDAARRNARSIRDRVHEEYNETRVTGMLLRALEGRA